MLSIMAYANCRPAGMSSDESEEDDFFYNQDQKQHDHAPAAKKKSDPSDFWKAQLNAKDTGDQRKKMKIGDLLVDAICKGDFKAVKNMINDGASCEQPLNPAFGSCGRRPVFLAAEEGQPEILEFLISKGGQLHAEGGNFTVLMAVCGSLNQDRDAALAKCLKILIQNKVDPNACQTQKITALMLACKGGHERVVLELIKVPDLDLDAQDTQRWTALMYAVDAGHGNIARHLLEAGANPNLAGSDGLLPIDLALSQHNMKLHNVITNYSKVKGKQTSGFEPMG